jgi:tRNA A-37 threonylcarbamoyl transferase component Bud32
MHRPWWLWLATASFVSYYLLVTLSIHHVRPGFGFVAEQGPYGASVVRVLPGTPAARAGFAAGDQPVVVNGWALNGPYDFTVMQGAYPTGVPVEWVVERAGTRTTLVLEPLERHWVWQTRMWVIVGVSLLTSLVMGLLIAFRGDGRPTTLLAAWLLVSIGCVTLPIWPRSMAYDWAQLPLPLGLLMWPAAASAIAVPMLMFTFCALVPRPVLSRRWLVIAQIPLALIVFFVITISTLMVYSPGRAMRVPIPPWVQVAGPLSYGLYTVGAALLMLVSLRRAGDATERRRVQTLLTGAAAGALGLLLLAPAFAWPRLSSAALLATGGVIFAIMPLTFAYATLRHKLFDLRVIVRLGLQYALARGLVLALVPLAVAALVVDVLLHGDQSLRSVLADRGWTYGVIAAGTVLAYSQREGWMTALDRRFFRERYAAQQILRQVVDDVSRAPDLDAAARKVVARIESALHPTLVAVMRKPGSTDAFTLASAAPDASAVAPLGAVNAITGIVRALGRPVVFGTQGLQDLPAADQAWLQQSDVELVVPILGNDHQDEALLVLGPRRSEEPYSQEDLELLGAIAASLALLPARPSRQNAEGTRQNDNAETTTKEMQPRRLGNRYRLEALIGSGGMGVVYSAVDETLGRIVAVKLVREDQLRGSDALERFQREARAAASLSHPHIVTVHDFGIDNGAPYLVMERLFGRSLRTAVGAERRLAPDRALAILRGVASAVEAAHARGMVHRDLKPENVFLAGDANSEIAKVLDFGIAKDTGSTNASTAFNTSTGKLVGTVPYMSPEQIAGGAPAKAWDVWSLAVITYEMLSGVNPFSEAAGGSGMPLAKAAAIRSFAPDLPAALDPFFDRALSLDPSLRPPTPTALHEELRAAL